MSRLSLSGLRAAVSAHLVFAFALVPALVACGDKDADDSDVGGIACTEEARSSVSLSLVSGGAPIPMSANPVAEFSVDAGASFTACEAVFDAANAEFVCGYEVAGTFLIRASADGFAPGETEVVVEADECHVIGQVVELELAAL
jgi:hypothetical protein